MSWANLYRETKERRDGAIPTQGQFDEGED